MSSNCLWCREGSMPPFIVVQHSTIHPFLIQTQSRTVHCRATYRQDRLCTNRQCRRKLERTHTDGENMQTPSRTPHAWNWTHNLLSVSCQIVFNRSMKGGTLRHLDEPPISLHQLPMQATGALLLVFSTDCD